MKKKKPEILEKPVHVALLKATHLEQLAKEGRLPASFEQAELPRETPAKKSKTGLVAFEHIPKKSFNTPDAKTVRKQTMLRAKLRVIHDSVPPADPAPPCDTCVAVCCRAFVVHITEEEYESGLYGDYAVKLPAEAAKQLRSKTLLSTTINGPNPYADKTQHVLEGLMGEPCAFLDKNNNCSIYDSRPIACRKYSCVGDERVTEDMRSGKEPVLSLVEQLMEGK